MIKRGSTRLTAPAADDREMAPQYNALDGSYGTTNHHNGAGIMVQVSSPLYRLWILIMLLTMYKIAVQMNLTDRSITRACVGWFTRTAVCAGAAKSSLIFSHYFANFEISLPWHWFLLEIAFSLPWLRNLQNVYIVFCGNVSITRTYSSWRAGRFFSLEWIHIRAPIDCIAHLVHIPKSDTQSFT